MRLPEGGDKGIRAGSPVRTVRLRLTTVGLAAVAAIVVVLTAAVGTAAAGTSSAGTATAVTDAAAAAPTACAALPPGSGAKASARTVRLCVRVQATGPAVPAGAQAGYVISVTAAGGAAHRVSVRIAASSSPARPAVAAPVFGSCGGGSGAGTLRCAFGTLAAGSGAASGLPAQVRVPASAPGGDQVTLSATAEGAATGGTPVTVTAAATVPVKARPTPSPSPSPTRSSSPSASPTPTSSSTPTPKPSDSGTPTPKPSDSGTPTPKSSSPPTPSPKTSDSPNPKPTHSRSPSPHTSAAGRHSGGHGTGSSGGGSGQPGTTQPPLPNLPPLNVGQTSQPGTGSVSHLFPAINPSPPPATAGNVSPRVGSTSGQTTRDPHHTRMTVADDSAPTDAPLAGGQLAALAFLLIAAALTAGAARAKSRPKRHH